MYASLLWSISVAFNPWCVRITCRALKNTMFRSHFRPAESIVRNETLNTKAEMLSRLSWFMSQIEELKTFRRDRGPVRRALCPGTRGVAGKAAAPRPSHTARPHVRGAPGAKPFLDDLLLGRGFVCSRAVPSLRSIGSQPSTQKKRKQKKPWKFLTRKEMAPLLIGLIPTSKLACNNLVMLVL